MIRKHGSLSPAKATARIREIARREFDLMLTTHARERLGERDLTTSDLLHLLKHGFVYAEAQPSTQPNHFKYLMESTTPNSGSRSLRAVVIPGDTGKGLKIISIMWVDEDRASS